MKHGIIPYFDPNALTTYLIGEVEFARFLYMGSIDLLE